MPVTKTIKLPYTPEALKKFLGEKKEILEKTSKGERVDFNEINNAFAEIPEHLRNKYKRKGQ